MLLKRNSITAGELVSHKNYNPAFRKTSARMIHQVSRTQIERKSGEEMFMQNEKMREERKSRNLKNILFDWRKKSNKELEMRIFLFYVIWSVIYGINLFLYLLKMKLCKMERFSIKFFFEFLMERSYWIKKKLMDNWYNDGMDKIELNVKNNLNYIKKIKFSILRDKITKKQSA